MEQQNKEQHRIELVEKVTFMAWRQAKELVEDYALQNMKKVKQAPVTGGKNCRYLCTSVDCAFFLYPWPVVISSLNLVHLNCTSVAQPTKRQLVKFPSFHAAASNTKPASAKALVRQVQQVYKVSAASTMRTVYRARNDILDEMAGDIGVVYATIESYLTRLRDINPSMVTAFDRHPNGVFSRVMFVLGVIASASHNNQLICSVDGGHIKGSNYKGFQLLLVGRDGNFANVTIAVALADSETKANYTKANYVWFFCNCIEAGVKLDVPIMGDRADALLTSALELSLGLLHCGKHIERNCNKEHRTFMAAHGTLVWKLQGSETEAAYKSTLAIISMLEPGGKAAAAYLSKIDPMK
ncbi:hypothetical protein ACHHYP_11107 [Achlya hypogyna]|uniref:MULE transposase domain-containing protein n=1 Tax=Achlya hypogyna TaxID=1202772 RepID=A0A1V9YJV9_ACHHY|nr:hypothetical protein ACHHYP_11107 [Achlya hypogyna]